MRKLLCTFIFILSLSGRTFGTNPDLGSNVLILDPSTTNAQHQLDEIFARQERAQFGLGRNAIFLKPGQYKLDARIGFYTQLAGLGQSPDDVQIAGDVRSTSEWMHGNATCNFWRSAENLSVSPNRGHMTWAVSQGTALRRVHVRGDLHLWDNGWSSGGFLADSTVDGKIVSGSQQQWICRNVDMARWDGGVWNMVFVGTNNPPSVDWPRRPYTVIDQTPAIREKPFLSLDENGNFGVALPALSSTATKGVSWSRSSRAAFVPIEKFFIAHPDRDDADTINSALARGENLLLTPGIYRLNKSIQIERAGTIVLGMGFATLIPQTGMSAIDVADVDGVEVAGLIIDAGPASSSALLNVGTTKEKASHSKEPTTLFDIVCRAGGASAGACDCFIKINSSDVIADNLWLWRADHGAGAKWDQNKVRNGLIVNGDNVTVYGLFVEHTQEYETIWNGNDGRLYFYQSEMPYDAPSQSGWSHESHQGYASYKVGDDVTTHEAFGLGVYCLFNDAPIVVDSAFEAPTAPGVHLQHLTTVRLGGRPNSGMSHILNATGLPVIATQKSQSDD